MPKLRASSTRSGRGRGTHVTFGASDGIGFRGRKPGHQLRHARGVTPVTSSRESTTNTHIALPHQSHRHTGRTVTPVAPSHQSHRHADSTITRVAPSRGSHCHTSPAGFRSRTLHAFGLDLPRCAEHQKKVTAWLARLPSTRQRGADHRQGRHQRTAGIPPSASLNPTRRNHSRDDPTRPSIPDHSQTARNFTQPSPPEDVRIARTATDTTKPDPLTDLPQSDERRGGSRRR
jgi:hypothetical protein